jgi:xanthine dehydrogenase accessory factor
MTGAASDVRSAAERLRSERRPFVAATVVRAERPTSAKAGDSALVLDDGSMVGFVGGECAEASVQAQALMALETGEPVLLRITPDAPEPPPGTTAGSPGGADGAVTVHNPCLSGGTLEIFLEPALPPPLVVIHGEAPIARAVRGLVEWLGYDGRSWADASGEGGPPIDADAVVVASHGGEEHAVLTAALLAGVPYVGLVASPRRGEAVLAALDVSDDEKERISTPAGFDIGASTPEEVALSILAEVVDRRPRDHHASAGARPDASPAHTADHVHADGHPPTAPVPAEGGRPAARATTAIDPVCGMTVAAVDSSRHLDHEGTRYWFCGSGCEDAFRADPGQFLPS